MSLYELLLVLHILAIAIWIGTGVAVNILLTRGRAGAALLPEVHWFGGRVFGAASGAAFVTGLLMVLDSDFVGIGDTWVILALTGWLASGLVGGAVLGKQVSAAAEGDASAIPKVVMVARVDLLILTLVVFDMVIKPGS